MVQRSEPVVVNNIDVWTVVEAARYCSNVPFPCGHHQRRPPKPACHFQFPKLQEQALANGQMATAESVVADLAVFVDEEEFQGAEALSDCTSLTGTFQVTWKRTVSDQTHSKYSPKISRAKMGIAWL